MSAVPAGVVPVVPRVGPDPPFQPPAGATCLSEEPRTYLVDGIVWQIGSARWILNRKGLLADALGVSQ